LVKVLLTLGFLRVLALSLDEANGNRS
jgi:hypothetical protein